METFKARVARLQSFTAAQNEMVIGSLLGDEHLVQTTRGFALRVNHSVRQREYVDWKYEQFKMFTNSEPATCKETYYFRTVSHEYFRMMRKLFYEGARKIIPETLRITPLALAVWIMDDGTREGRQLRINSHAFTLRENEMLQHLLWNNLGIKATINRDRQYFRLRIAEESMAVLKMLVTPYVIPSMSYKLSL